MQLSIFSVWNILRNLRIISFVDVIICWLLYFIVFKGITWIFSSGIDGICISPNDLSMFKFCILFDVLLFLSDKKFNFLFGNECIPNTLISNLFFSLFDIMFILLSVLNIFSIFKFIWFLLIVFRLLLLYVELKLLLFN